MITARSLALPFCVAALSAGCVYRHSDGGGGGGGSCVGQYQLDDGGCTDTPPPVGLGACSVTSDCDQGEFCSDGMCVVCDPVTEPCSLGRSSSSASSSSSTSSGSSTNPGSSSSSGSSGT